MTDPLTVPDRDRSTRESAGLAAQVEAVVACCRRLHARGLVAGAEGNVSVRLLDGSILITATGADKATIESGQVLRCYEDGTLCDNDASLACASGVPLRDGPSRPSSEVQMHIGIYAARPDVKAVVHAHPPVATGFAAAHRTIPANVLPELPVVVGPVALVPYGRPGTSALPDAIRAFVADHEVFLLANHGVTTVGRSLADATMRMESVEQAARILLSAELLGGAKPLPNEESDALSALWRPAGPRASREAGIVTDATQAPRGATQHIEPQPTGVLS